MAKRYYRKANKYGLGDALKKAWGDAFSLEGLNKEVSAGIGAVGSVLGLGASSALSGGRNTGVGNAIGNIGGTIGGALSSINPVLGGIASIGSGVIGGAVNNLFGSKINQERVNQANLEIGSALGFNANAGDFDTLLSEANSSPVILNFSRSDIGSDGVFSNKAKKLYLELKQKQEIADQWVASSIENNALNIAENRLNQQLAGYYALGGNLFSDGGGIHIKPSKRGTFTAAAKKHGKSVQAFASLVLANKENYSPAMVKKANFARNASKWHDEGGPLTDSEYISIMEKVAKDNYKKWKFNNEDEALVHALNDNAYNYREYYNKYPNSRANASTHWPDDFKTVYHPTFSNQSIYSGKKSQYNPYGLIGGSWDGEIFIPADWQRDSRGDSLDTVKQDNTRVYTPEYFEPIKRAFSGVTNNKKAFGGELSTHGGLFSNGVTTINNGGTHEENPYLGIQIGMDLEGTPNLVEEGETIWNDYVFSNRLIVPDSVRRKYKIRGKKDLTFSDVAKKILKESSETPNDPISKNGLEAGLSSLMIELEAMKLEQLSNKYSRGGRLYDGTLPYPNLLKFDEKPFTSNVWKYSVPLLSAQIGIANAKADLFLNKLLGFRTKENTDTTENTDTPVKDNWMRYAPIAGSAIGLGLTLFSKPDYSGAENIRRAANDIANVLKVGYTPLGDYLTYKPFDTDYYVNKLQALAGANRRALANLAGGNRATATAGLLAADYDTIGKIGDLARQALEANLAQRLQVATFNRGTNQANTEMGLKAAVANLEALMKARLAKLSGISTAETMRDTIDSRRAAALSAGVTGLFDNIGSAGKEKLMMDIVNNHPSLLYDFFVSYKNKSSKGGKINRKKGGFTY